MCEIDNVRDYVIEAYTRDNYQEFSNIDLRGADFQRYILNFINLKKCDLRYSKFAQAELKDADFSDSLLDEADLTHSDLHRVNFKNSTVDKAYLHGANMFGVDLEIQNKTKEKRKCIGKNLREQLGVK